MTVYDIGACPVCQTHDFRTLADADEIKAEMESLWSFHLRRLQVGAPIQQLFDRTIFSQEPPLHLTQCRRCGTVLRNPREAAEAVVATYAEEEPPAEAFDTLFAQQRSFYEPRVRLLTKLNDGPGSVLEVGSYIGGFLAASQEAGWKAVGVDVNEHANAYARRRKLDVVQSSLDDYADDRAFDVVAIWNCFDQLPEPRATLEKAASLLKPNGLVTLRVPNGECYAALRERAAFHALLAHNNLLGFPYRHGFSERALQQLLADTGFKVGRLRGDTLVSTAGAWTRGWARLEERVVKRGMKLLLPKRMAPWIELYARKTYSF